MYEKIDELYLEKCFYELMIYNMEKINVYVENVFEYKRVCDKIHKMWYVWASNNKLNEYCYIDDFKRRPRTMYSSYWVIRRTTTDRKAIPARKFLWTYDL